VFLTVFYKIGHGHTLHYLDHKRVTKYIALEPNALMHPHIRSLANSLGYSESAGSLQILSCGAEEITSWIPVHSVDTMISILTLCTVSDLQKTVNELVLALKPGGTFLFYEHVLSPRADVRWWQKFWTPMWSVVFDGCRLDRATDKVVRELGSGEGVWEEEQTWGKVGENVEECLFWHQVGKFVKA
jgi:SAM-dependent methyltransferase